MIGSRQLNRQSDINKLGFGSLDLRSNARLQQRNLSSLSVVDILPGPSGQINLPIQFQNSMSYYDIYHHIVQDPWLIDLSTTTIDLTNRKGGVIDGIGPTGDTNYLLWGFVDRSLSLNQRFQGFGATAQPLAYPADVSSGGDLGTLTAISVPTGEGFKFTVGARVIYRAGADYSLEYNQGTITEVTSDLVRVQLDASYAVAFSGLNGSNTACVGATNWTLLQIDKYRPYLKGGSTQSQYPGSGVEYDWCYIGMVTLDSSGNIAQIRLPGGVQLLRTPSSVFNYTGTSVPTSGVYCARRVLPTHVQDILIRGYINSAQNLQGLEVGPESTMVIVRLNVPIKADNADRYGNSLIKVGNLHSLNINFAGTAGATGIWEIDVCGWIDQEW